jgi:hypothetical protein
VTRFPTVEADSIKVVVFDFGIVFLLVHVNSLCIHSPSLSLFLILILLVALSLALQLLWWELLEISTHNLLLNWGKLLLRRASTCPRPLRIHPLIFAGNWGGNCPGKPQGGGYPKPKPICCC